MMVKQSQVGNPLTGGFHNGIDCADCDARTLPTGAVRHMRCKTDLELLVNTVRVAQTLRQSYSLLELWHEPYITDPHHRG